MKIILSVDAIHPPLTGIGNYALQLANGLKSYPGIDEVRYFADCRWVDDPMALLYKPSVTSGLRRLQRQIPFKALAARLYTNLRHQLFARHAQRFERHLLHAPNYILMPFRGPSVTTVHDLSHLRYPQYHPRERVAYLAQQLPRTLRQASAVITVSEFVRQEVIEQFKLPAERVYSVYNGVDKSFCPLSSQQLRPVLDHYGLRPQGYLLMVATLEPRKNLLRLIDAFEALSPTLRSSYPLVLVGTRGWLTEPLERRLQPLLARGEIKQLGYLPQQHLPALYGGARAFAFPSIYEGFGLPVLEAMACGTPVLTANRSALPEVSQGAAWLVDPERVEEIAHGLEQVLTDETWRRAAVERGLARAKELSWRRCVTETVAVYRQFWEA